MPGLERNGAGIHALGKMGKAAADASWGSLDARFSKLKVGKWVDALVSSLL